MATFKEFLAGLKPGKSDRETYFEDSIKGLGIDIAEVEDAKDATALGKLVQAFTDKKVSEAVATAKAEGEAKLVKVSDALKASGFDFTSDGIEGLKAAVEARVEKEGAARAAKITAGHKIPPVPSGSPDGAAPQDNLKGRARVVAYNEKNLPQVKTQ